MNVRIGLFITPAMVAAVAASAAADPRPASTGWYAEGGVGAVGFLADAATDAKVGPVLDLRVGRDLFSWLSLGAFGAASSHEETVPAPPVGDWFQLYRIGVEARVSVPIGPCQLFAEGGFGAAVISTNILDKVMITTPDHDASVMLQAGGGLEYQLHNRHYALGLAGDFAIEPSFASVKQVDGRAYLRYTY